MIPQIRYFHIYVSAAADILNSNHRMDSLTHAVIGACAGEILLGKKIGKSALLIGALAQNIPDIDFVAGLWMAPAHNLLAHRGLTHSFLFAALVSVCLAWICRRSSRSASITSRTWIFFFALQLIIHLFLDAFNAYGIGWFEPFSHYRISFNTVFVADPFFSIWPGIACLALLILRKRSPRRIPWAISGLALSALYLVYCVFNKYQVDDRVKNSLAQQGVSYKRYFSTPTPFNNWLWYVVVEKDSGYYTAYRSVFDKSSPTCFHYFPRNENLLESFHSREDIALLKRFSKGYYTIESRNDTLLFNVLRFGQTAGWRDPNSIFVFHYYLQHPSANRFVMQRGRFENWNAGTIKGLIRSIQSPCLK